MKTRNLTPGGICNIEHQTSFQLPNNIRSALLSKLRIEVATFAGNTTYIDRLFDSLAEEVEEVAERIMHGENKEFSGWVEDMINQETRDKKIHAAKQKNMVFEIVLDWYR